MRGAEPEPYSSITKKCETRTRTVKIVEANPGSQSTSRPPRATRLQWRSRPPAVRAARASSLLARNPCKLRRMLSTEGARDAAVLALVAVLGGGAAYAAVEKSSDGQALSAWDGVWWAITTVTTVGYRDSYATTTGGRIIAVVMMLVGIGFVAILTAAAAARFTLHARTAGRRSGHRVIATRDSPAARGHRTAGLGAADAGRTQHLERAAGPRCPLSGRSG